MTLADRRLTVSIITPCYNGGRFIRDTVASALAQSRPPLEVIVIDDGSTDDSAAIAEAFGPPVRVVRQTNHGESFARNRGLELAQGSHVLFLDADDLLAPDALLHLAGALDDRPGAIAIMGCEWFSDEPTLPTYTKELPYRRFYPEIISTNFGPPLCWLSPVEAIRKAGGFCETLHWFEDWDLWWRVGLEEPDLIPVPYIGARYRQHLKSQLATVSAANRARGHAALAQRMCAAFLERPKMLAAYGEPLFWNGWTALSRAKAAGVPWPELSAIADLLREVAAKGPDVIRRSTTGRLVRLAGTRIATLFA